MRIVLLGAPGAGKGTQCKRIVERFKVEHLSSGDILRKERAEGTELGKKAQSYMDSGGLVPDELIVKMMAEAINNTGDSGFVLDGFPRTVNQASELDKSLEKIDSEIQLAVNLEISDEVVLERMTGRRSCTKCGAVYHITNLPAKVEGKCDNDGAELVQRPDDKKEVVEKRLKVYHEQTKPVSDYYRDKGLLEEIDAEIGAEKVSEILFEKLAKLT
jgi:adenylate kinase